MLDLHRSACHIKQITSNDACLFVDQNCADKFPHEML